MEEFKVYDFDDRLNKALENPEIKDLYEKLDFKYQVIKASIEYRKQNKLSQRAFAEMLGLKQQAISRFEKGEIDPSLTFLIKVLSAMKFKISIQKF